MSILIPATNPIVKPATPEVTYDQWILVGVSITQSGEDVAPSGEAWFQACRVLSDGKIEYTDKKVNIAVPDLLTHSTFTKAGYSAVVDGLEKAAKDARLI
jgi:hypothetical protein